MYHSQDINQVQTILSGLRLMCDPGQVYELRCLKTKADGTVAGYYNNLERLAADAAERTQFDPAVYLTLNPVDPALLARSINRCQRKAQATTKDMDIVRRLRLLIDFDPSRPAGISSTDEEHSAALDRAKMCRDWLTARGWPLPLYASSGNGAHLVYGVDLPNDDTGLSVVNGVLKALAERYSDATVKVDPTVGNASRICKMYGTWTRKGENLEERPHRVSRIIEAPDRLETVARELMEDVAGPSGPKAETHPTAAATHGLDRKISWMENFIVQHGIDVRQTKEDNSKFKKVFILEKCPFCGHEDKSAIITVSNAGTYGFRCHHNSCTRPKKTWTDFRGHYDTEWTPEDNKKENTADVLTALARATVKLWRTPDGNAYMTLPNGRNCAIGGSDCKSFLGHLYYQETGKGVNKTALEQADATLEAIALHDAKSPTYQTYRRYARLGDKLHVDLGDESGDAVIITGDGWTLGKPPVKFLRCQNLKALPRPERGGDINLLRPFFNGDDENFYLAVGSILDAMKGVGPYLVTTVNGEQGSAKSTWVRVMRRLIDPTHNAELTNCPRSVDDLCAQCQGTHLVCPENVSKLPQWMSDAFCQVSTGSGLSKRKLYTNDEQHIIGVCNPVVLNGIADFTEAPDLASRSAPIVLDPLPDDGKWDEVDLWPEFYKVVPHILGVIYDACAHGLKTMSAVQVAKKPRMADTARWIAATFPALGWTYDDWYDPYTAAHQSAGDLLVDNSLPGRVLREWFGTLGVNDWAGTPTELWELLAPRCADCYPPEQSRYFPQSGQKLSNALRKIAPELRRQGLDVKTGGHKKIKGKCVRQITVEWVDGEVDGGLTAVGEVDGRLTPDEVKKVDGCRMVDASEKHEASTANTSVFGQKLRWVDGLTLGFTTSKDREKEDRMALIDQETSENEREQSDKRFAKTKRQPSTVNPDALETVLAAVAERYGQAEADTERTRIGLLGASAPARIEVLRQALQSSAWLVATRPQVVSASA